MSIEPWLTDEHRRFQARVREFALAKIAPVARELDEHSTFPFETVRAMAEEGLLGLPIPRELGGQGMDTLSYILAVEELAKHDASHAITVSAHTTLGTSPIVTFGTKEQREKWVPPESEPAPGSVSPNPPRTRPGPAPIRAGPGRGRPGWRGATGCPAPRSSSPMRAWGRFSRSRP